MVQREGKGKKCRVKWIEAKRGGVGWKDGYRKGKMEENERKEEEGRGRETKKDTSQCEVFMKQTKSKTKRAFWVERHHIRRVSSYLPRLLYSCTLMPRFLSRPKSAETIINPRQPSEINRNFTFLALLK